VENAIKHGTSQLLGVGNHHRASQDGDHLVLDIEDNAGLYQPKTDASGLGMSLVDSACGRALVMDAAFRLPASLISLPELPYDSRWRKAHVKSADC
jgi:two-component sensor histidine kinase